MPKICENWLRFVNSCAYYANQTRGIYRVLPYWVSQYSIIGIVGYGFMMSFAIAAMYKVAKSILGTDFVTAIIEARITHIMFLFNLFVARPITMFKEKCGRDGFLNWLHILMLMGDMVILATSRNKVLEKLNILYDYCDTHEWW